jgi:hypothetical protein
VAMALRRQRSQAFRVRVRWRGCDSHLCEGRMTIEVLEVRRRDRNAYEPHEFANGTAGRSFN